MNNLVKVVIFICLIISSCKSTTYYPKQGFVPNEATAIRIAEAIWLPLFGEDIYMQKPYYVKLKNGIWTVKGRLNSKPGEIVLGGTVYIEINQKDGQIKKVSHGV